MTDAVSQEIGKQLNKLKLSIQSHNTIGDIYGLFSHHILTEAAEWREEWNVLCDSDWLSTQFDEKNVYSLAALGFSLQNLSSEVDAAESFVKAFDLLMQRNPFKGPPVSFPFQPVTLTGLILGIKKISDEGWREKATEWLSLIISKRTEGGNLTEYQKLQYSYVNHILDEASSEISVDTSELTIEGLSILEYGLKRGVFKVKNQENMLSEIRKNLIQQIVKNDISDDVDEKAALMWIAVEESISSDIENYLLSPHFVSAILSRFEDAMKRWRYDSDDLKKPIRWPITSEREVQDILWLILRSYFEDLVDEDALPKFGHKYHITDFAMPSLRLLIEVKYVYKRTEFKKIEEQIMVDSVAYLSKTQDYDKIIVFIYDESSSVQEYGTTKNDLMKILECLR